MKVIKELNSYLLIIVIVLVIRTFIFTPILVHGESMVPTLKGGELMILKKYDKKYERFDVVVVSKNVEGEELIKRVIGLPGETIKYFDGKLYINNEIIDDPYAYGETDDFSEYVLGDDEYFVMGDNREVSLDSRLIGIIKYREIEGTTNFVLFPFKSFGKIK